MIVAVALTVVPVDTLIENGTVKLILNVSFPSTMSSFINVMLTVLLLVPAIMVMTCRVELKSMSPPTKQILNTVSIVKF